jgi:hypothetical protein
MSMFGILRRPPGPEDSSPSATFLRDELGGELRSYLSRYIRQLVREPNGDHYFLVVGYPG